jgi:hypothetical protein
LPVIDWTGRNATRLDLTCERRARCPPIATVGKCEKAYPATAYDPGELDIDIFQCSDVDTAFAEI